MPRPSAAKVLAGILTGTACVARPRRQAMVHGSGRGHALSVELPLFDEVAGMFRGMVPPDLGEFRHRARRYGIKIWFGPSTPLREHYETQVIAPDAVDDAIVLALEVGFHAEHPQVADNEAVLAHLLDVEDQWRRVLGHEAVAGPFLGRADRWRRISETWPDPDLSDPDLAVELAARLSEYVAALEPLRRDR